MKVLIADRLKLLLEYAEGLISKFNICQVIKGVHDQFIAAELEHSNYDILIMFNQNGFLDYSRIKKITKTYNQMNILVVCFNMDRNVVIDLARLGIKGLVDGTTADRKEFIKAVKLIGKKESYYSESIQGILMHQFKTKNTVKNSRSNTISERELLILQLISDGYSNSEIAEKINISAFTVKNHRSSLLKKMEVKNTAQMMKKSFRDKILIP